VTTAVEEKIEEKVESMDAEGDGVGAVEGAAVGRCESFEGFLGMSSVITSHAITYVNWK